MPYLPTDLPTDIIRRYYTESCYKITSHAILTDGRTDGYLSVGITQRVATKLQAMPSLPTDVPTDIIRRYYTESCDKITSHAILTDGRDVGNYPCNYRRNNSVSNVPAGNFFLARAYPSVCPSVFPSVGCFFYLRQN